MALALLLAVFLGLAGATNTTPAISVDSAGNVTTRSSFTASAFWGDGSNIDIVSSSSMSAATINLATTWVGIATAVNTHNGSHNSTYFWVTTIHNGDVLPHVYDCEMTINGSLIVESFRQHGVPAASDYATMGGHTTLTGVEGTSTLGLLCRTNSLGGTQTASTPHITLLGH
mgnify:CR=1 FL=1